MNQACHVANRHTMNSIMGRLNGKQEIETTEECLAHTHTRLFAQNGRLPREIRSYGRCMTCMDYNTCMHTKAHTSLAMKSQDI